ncbi:MAG: TIR domain-containing protein [Verrucomicrobiales bacterium]|nr:TIR domain-containing protein [Verrucomicrobiales bacterium]
MARVFISHSTRDDRFVAEVEAFVAELLGCDVFNDVRSLRAGRKFWPVIKKGIQNCEVLVVVVSEASMQSQWVRKEVDLARKLKKTLIPLRIEDCAAPIFDGVKMLDFRRDPDAEPKSSTGTNVAGLKSLYHLPTVILLAAAVWQFVAKDLSSVFILSGIAVCYEILLLLFQFCRILWEDEFQKEAVNVLASWIRGALENLRPGLIRNYRKALRSQFGLFNNRGLGLINANRLKLDQVFVSLRIASAHNIDEAEGRLLTRFGEQLSPGTHSIWDFLRNLKEDGVALCIIGPPGCGKTTLLQHILLIMANNQQRRFRMQSCLPALIYLRDIQHEVCAAENLRDLSLGEILEIEAARRMPKLRIPKGWFEKQLSRGRMLILLDGLDEVGSEERRKTISSWLDIQIGQYQQSRIIVTARPQGYQTAPLDRANVLEVRHFSPNQVQNFIRNWYHANEVVSRGNLDNKEVREKANEESNDLLERLRQVPALLELTCNPLLLTMICMVHRYRGELPGGRVLLYEEICKVLLEKWRQGKQIIEELRGDQKLLALMPLAAEMMERGVREIDTESARKIIAGPLERVGLSPEKQEKFLHHLSEDSGLLLEKEEGLWAFAHLTFQEYLAARCWATCGEGAPTDDFTSRVANSWWHETLRLYGSQADASPIVAACLWQGDPKALALAFACLEEAREVSAADRDRAIAVLEEGLESGDPAKFNIAAEAWFEIRNNHDLFEIKEGTHLRRSPVSKAEYQLFINSTGKSPDHWIGDRLIPGTAKDPVLGVRPSDAVAYTAWLNDESGRRGYRVATGKDLEAGSPRKAQIPLDTALPPPPEEEFRRQLGIPFPESAQLCEEFPRLIDAGPRAIQWSISFGSLARVKTLELDRARALCPVLARARAAARSLPVDLDLTLTLDHILNEARAIALARALDLDLDLDQVPEVDYREFLTREKLSSLKSTLHRWLQKKSDSPGVNPDGLTDVQVDLNHELELTLAKSFAGFDKLTGFKTIFHEWINSADDPKKSAICLSLGLKCFDRALPGKDPAERFVLQWARFWLSMMRLSVSDNSIENTWQAWLLAGAEIALLSRASLEMELEKGRPKGVRRLFSKVGPEDEEKIREMMQVMDETAGYILTALCRQLKIIDEGAPLYLVRETSGAETGQG